MSLFPEDFKITNNESTAIIVDWEFIVSYRYNYITPFDAIPIDISLFSLIMKYITKTAKIVDTSGKNYADTIRNFVCKIFHEGMSISRPNLIDTAVATKLNQYIADSVNILILSKKSVIDLSRDELIIPADNLMFYRSFKDKYDKINKYISTTCAKHINIFGLDESELYKYKSLYNNYNNINIEIFLTKTNTEYNIDDVRRNIKNILKYVRYDPDSFRSIYYEKNPIGSTREFIDNILNMDELDKYLNKCDEESKYLSII